MSTKYFQLGGDTYVHMLMRHSEDVMIFNLVGDLVGGKNCENIIRDFRSLVNSGTRNFAINFSNVRLVNSQGINCLIGAKTTVDLVGGVLVLCCLERRNLSTIYKLRLQEVFEIADDLPAALEALAAGIHPTVEVDQ